MDRHPGLRVRIERIGGHRSRLTQSIKVIDQGKSAVLIAEPRYLEDVLRLIEIVSVVAVRKHLGVRVPSPALIDIGNDLVARSKLGKAASLGDVLARLLIPLIAIEDAQRNVQREANGVVRPIAVVVGLKRGVCSAVGIG